MEAAEIQNMSSSEKLQAMELLWDALTHEADSVPTPPWHAEVLAQRLERIRNGKGTFLTVEETKKRLAGSLSRGINR